MTAGRAHRDPDDDCAETDIDWLPDRQRVVEDRATKAGASRDKVPLTPPPPPPPSFPKRQG